MVDIVDAVQQQQAVALRFSSGASSWIFGQVTRCSGLPVLNLILRLLAWFVNTANALSYDALTLVADLITQPPVHQP